MATQQVYFRNGLNTDDDLLSHRTGLACSTPSLTQQHMRDECDINIMVERFARGQDVPVPPAWPSVDLDRNYSYQEMLNTVIAAEQAFFSLDAKLRERFQNDPAQLMEFLSSDKNRDEAISLGLIDKAVEPVVQAVRIVDPQPASSVASVNEG